MRLPKKDYLSIVEAYIVRVSGLILTLLFLAKHIEKAFRELFL